MTNQIFYYLEIPVVINFHCQRHSRQNLNENYKTLKIIVVFVKNELPKTESLSCCEICVQLYFDVKVARISQTDSWNEHLEALQASQ